MSYIIFSRLKSIIGEAIMIPYYLYIFIYIDLREGYTHPHISMPKES